MCHLRCIPPLLLTALCLHLLTCAIHVHVVFTLEHSKTTNQTQNALLSNQTTFLLSNNFQKFDLVKRMLPPNADLDMAFISSGGKIALSFSICAKCGSTSFYAAFFESVYGHKFNDTAPGPPWVQQWIKWPKSGRPVGSSLLYAGHIENSAISMWNHYHVYRDPINRYMSAFFSKLCCCEPQRDSIASGLNRSRCMSDESDKNTDRIIKSLFNHSGTPIPASFEKKNERCLYFDEFVDLITQVTYPKELDPHVRPQWPIQKEKHPTHTWVGNISELSLELNHLFPKLGLKPIEIKKEHQTTNRINWRPSPSEIQGLCEFAAAEYAGFLLPLNPICVGIPPSNLD